MSKTVEQYRQDAITVIELLKGLERPMSNSNESLEEMAKNVLELTQRITTPSPDVAGSDAVGFAGFNDALPFTEWLLAKTSSQTLLVSDGDIYWHDDNDGDQPLTVEYLIDWWRKEHNKHPQPAGASVEGLFLKVISQEQDEIVLENSKGDTYTSRSEGLIDFLSGAAFQSAQGQTGLNEFCDSVQQAIDLLKKRRPNETGLGAPIHILQTALATFKKQSNG